MVEAKSKWVPLREDPAVDYEQLVQQTGLSRLVVTLLVDRGYRTPAAINDFLHPQETDLHDPFRMHGMQAGVARIKQAIVAGEKIVVYGDYDVDGLTSTAIMVETLEQLGANVEAYIPDRFKDGYGPNKAAYDRLIAAGAQLIVTVDNGVSGKDVIAATTKQGVDVVVTDHHELPRELPAASAVIHPRHPAGRYPFGGLSGAGVAFKVASALLEEPPAELLDLVALGTVADLVPLIDENRALVTFGLTALRTTTRPGLQALLKATKTAPEEIDEETISYTLAPCLNALGRMEQAQVGVELLTTFDQERATELAEHLTKLNDQRKQLVDQITTEAGEYLAHKKHSHAVNVVWGTDWHEGVLGIVASRLVEQTGNPTVVLNYDGTRGEAKGSGRSVAAYNLFTALDGHRDLMTSFGGHHMACGLACTREALQDLQTVLDEEYSAQVTQPEKSPLTISGRLSAQQVTVNLIDELAVLAPFGPDNPKPVFEVTGVTPPVISAMGKKREHLRVTFQETQLNAVAFSVGDVIPQLKRKRATLRIVGELSKNVFWGRVTPQVMIKDMMTTDTDEASFGPIKVIDNRIHRWGPKLFTTPGTYVCFDERLANQLIAHLPPRKNVTVCSANAPLNPVRTLTVVDCPPNRNQFQRVLREVCPAVVRIFAHHGTARLGLPSRAQFGKLYKFARQHHQVDVRHRFGELAAYLHLPENDLVFMVQVLQDAGLVTINAGLMDAQVPVQTVDLTVQPRYKARADAVLLEHQLLDSSVSALTALVQELAVKAAQ
ncbi:single-stranded-DNA-specific exonuclease RecJ [Ligilactobacillus sp. LYQ60]|uniref:single-stranded-DNA-specific exonuclease RecJ n=1 Tax=unclassified Ligilactobacillus TaxID=2767920 RepID=UPI003851F9D2